MQQEHTDVVNSEFEHAGKKQEKKGRLKKKGKEERQAVQPAGIV